jgi:hypothetical protein
LFVAGVYFEKSKVVAAMLIVTFWREMQTFKKADLTKKMIFSPQIHRWQIHIPFFGGILMINILQ